MGMKWAATYCENAKFMLKIDDDISFNVYRVMNYLDNLLLESSNNLRKTMICKIHRKAGVIRNPRNKFYVSKELYPKDVYPDYCDGPAYIFTADLAEMFYKRSLKTKMFVFEDVNIGMLAENLNVKFIDIDKYYDKYLLTKSDSLFSERAAKRIHNLFFIMVKDRFDLIFVWGTIIKRFDFLKIFN